MGWIGSVRYEKSRRDFVVRTFALIALVHPVLHRVSCSYEMIPNAPKHYETHQNMSLGSNGVDQARSLQKNYNVTWWHELLHLLHQFSMFCNKFHAVTKFCITCSSSPSFAPSFKQLRNDPKCTQTLWNTPKHGISVWWGGSGALFAKNYNVTSWHDLLN